MSRVKPVIAVVGAGRMGAGIAQAFAYAGHRVELIDARERGEEEARQVLQAATGQIAANLNFLSSMGVLARGSVKEVMGRVGCHHGKELAQALSGAGVIFEAVPEVLEVKRKVFAEIGSLAGPEALVASTTSTFLVDTLASFLEGPERFLNTHWLNPAYLIPLVEVSPGRSTAPEALREMLSLLESAGKVPVRCAASPGFIVPRIQALAMNEAARLVEEGVAAPEDIDKATRLGFGLRFAVLGLLEFIDWGGGDILYYAGNYLQDALGAQRYSPPDIIARNMKEGRTGLKAGQGFYDFSDRDVSAYQQETMKKFVDLLKHLGLLAPPGKA